MTLIAGAFKAVDDRLGRVRFTVVDGFSAFSPHAFIKAKLAHDTTAKIAPAGPPGAIHSTHDRRVPDDGVRRIARADFPDKPRFKHSRSGSSRHMHHVHLGEPSVADFFLPHTRLRPDVVMLAVPPLVPHIVEQFLASSVVCRRRPTRPKVEDLLRLQNLIGVADASS